MYGIFLFTGPACYLESVDATSTLPAATLAMVKLPSPPPALEPHTRLEKIEGAKSQILVGRAASQQQCLSQQDAVGWAWRVPGAGTEHILIGN